MSIHLLVEEAGYFYYQLRVIVATAHSFEFELRQISTWEGDESNTPVIDDSEIAASGFVKWDGCANIMFDGGGYAHFCGVNDIRRHGMALIEVYRIAHEFFVLANDAWYARENPDDFLVRV